MPTSAITTIISDDESEYSIQRAGLMPRETFRSYQRCSHGEASAVCATADTNRNAATSGPIRRRKSSSGAATRLSVKWRAAIAPFQRRRPVSFMRREAPSAGLLGARLNLHRLDLL